MKRLLLGLLAMPFCLLHAQLPEDVLRNSYHPQHGTARSMAIGGAIGSLGGDINALFVNPAGLGLYKTKEFVISPGFVTNNNKASFRGSELSANKSGFDLGTSGLVIGFEGQNNNWVNQAFSIGINQTANFNNQFSYKGTNNFSSGSEQYSEQLSQSNQSVDDALNNPAFAYGTAPAIYTYLVDTFRNAAGGLDVKGLPEFLLANGVALNQEKHIKTSGGIYEVALGYAANMNDRFYIGGSLGIPIINYSRTTQYRESDPTGNKNNNFDYFEHNSYLTTKGFGLNGKLGAIYKPAESFRLGLTIHTPTFYSLTDRESSSMTTNTEGYAGTVKVTSDSFTLYLPGKTLYTASTPFKTILSASYVFREEHDVRRQRGFVSADVEYVGYKGAAFRPDGENITYEDQQYYDDLKSVINNTYRGAFNYRIGGELKFNTVMFRLGGAYYTNPYKDTELKTDMMQVTGGLGYRNHGIFIDIAYVQNINKDVNFPYLLSEKANTYAVQNNKRGNLLLTLGFKF